MHRRPPQPRTTSVEGSDRHVPHRHAIHASSGFPAITPSGRVIIVVMINADVSRPMVAVTGAAGYVAELVLPLLRDAFRLRRIDVVDHEGAGDDEVICADVADVDLMAETFAGVFGVLHLAAKAFEEDFVTVLQPRNITATWSVFEACRRAAVRRVVFSSTGQTIGGNPGGSVVTPDMPPRPVSVYAATKLFGEALARYHADQGHFGVACLRLGWVAPGDSPLFATEPTLRETWCSPADLARLIAGALSGTAEYAIVHAFSGTAAEGADTSNPFGWQPTDHLSQANSLLRPDNVPDGSAVRPW